MFAGAALCSCFPGRASLLPSFLSHRSHTTAQPGVFDAARPFFDFVPRLLASALLEALEFRSERFPMKVLRVPQLLSALDPPSRRPQTLLSPSPFRTFSHQHAERRRGGQDDNCIRVRAPAACLWSLLCYTNASREVSRKRSSLRSSSASEERWHVPTRVRLLGRLETRITPFPPHSDILIAN